MEVRDVKSIRVAKYNPRRINEFQFASLKQSIERFGFVDPVIVNDRTNTLVGGHQRLKAAKDLGLKHVPVVALDLSEEEEKALNVALNKISGEWDMELLKGVLEDVRNGGLELSLTGFTDGEIESLLGSSTELDYSVLDGDDKQDELDEMELGVKRGLVIDFDVEAEYTAAAELAKKARLLNVDLGHILYEALVEWSKQ